MKKFIRNPLLWFIAIAIFSWTCRKAENKAFAGNGHIRGVVYYNDITTNTLDTAATAQLILQWEGKTSTAYIQNLTNGTFDITSLSSGTYTFSINYTHVDPGTSKSVLYILKGTFQLGENEFVYPLNFILKHEETQSPTLQLTVVDANNVVVSNAQVCLYDDTTTLAANRGTCSGSVKSAVTNAQGIAVFDGLQGKTYYASVFATSGSISVSNQATEQNSIVIPSTFTVTPFNVTVTPVGYSLEITALDAQKTPLANANIYVYSDSTLLSKYRFTSSGSIRSGVTNSQGMIVFSGLTNGPYFVSAYQIVGTDTLSNKGNDTSHRVNLALNNLNPLPETLVKQSPPLAQTTFSVTITDQFNAFISGANVCLYSDKGLLTQFREQCTGSLLSGVTNGQGNVVFGNLQSNVTYYISAYKVVGTDTLSNKTIDVSDPIPLKANQQTLKTIIIKQ